MTTDIDTAAQELRAHHRLCPVESGCSHGRQSRDHCYQCQGWWPCPTIRVLDRLAELERGKEKHFEAIAEWNSRATLAEARAEAAEGYKASAIHYLGETTSGWSQVNELKAQLAQATAALEKLVADNTKRGMTSGALSWARLILKRQEPT